VSRPRIDSPDIDRRVIADMRAGMSDFMTDDRRWTDAMERKYDDALRKTTLYAVASLTYAIEDVGRAFVDMAKADAGRLLRLLYGGSR